MDRNTIRKDCFVCAYYCYAANGNRPGPPHITNDDYCFLGNVPNEEFVKKRQEEHKCCVLDPAIIMSIDPEFERFNTIQDAMEYFYAKYVDEEGTGL